MAYIKRSGQLRNDPELRYTSSGLAIATFNMQSGTDIYNVVCFARLAEKATDKLKKGMSIKVIGYFKTRVWQDRDGKDRSTIELKVKSIHLRKAS